MRESRWMRRITRRVQQCVTPPPSASTSHAPAYLPLPTINSPVGPQCSFVAPTAPFRAPVLASSWSTTYHHPCRAFSSATAPSLVSSPLSRCFVSHRPLITPVVLFGPHRPPFYYHPRPHSTWPPISSLPLAAVAAILSSPRACCYHCRLQLPLRGAAVDITITLILVLPSRALPPSLFAAFSAATFSSASACPSPLPRPFELQRPPITSASLSGLPSTVTFQAPPLICRLRVAASLQASLPNHCPYCDFSSTSTCRFHCVLSTLPFIIYKRCKGIPPQHHH